MPDDGPARKFVDATFGRGGHTRALLARLDADARVVATDRDPAAVAAGRELAAADPRLTVRQATFSTLGDVLDELGFDAVDGIIMDLGVSSPQLDAPERGFSFREDGPLDMRMDPAAGSPAAAWLNRATAEEIAGVLRTFGEERYARRIARAIVAARPLHTTLELAAVVEKAQPPQRDRAKHPATRTFQAVRIFVNDEIEEIERGLKLAFERLRPGGRLAVISFHSLEDRLVKQTFRAFATPARLPRRLPVRASAEAPAARLLRGPVRAGEREVVDNPRARSATLRVVERLR